MQFYKCLKCNKIIMVLKSSHCGTFCCDEEMVEIKANSVDAAQEKHVPVVEIKDKKIKVRVGEVEHPMMDAHYIEWIAVKTNFGNQRKLLKPGEKPEAKFALLPGEKVEAVLEFCNLHGLYSTK